MGIRPLAVTCALAVALSGFSRPALAAHGGLQAPLGEPDEGEEAEEQPTAPASPLPVLDTTPRWAAGLEGYAGIGVQWTSGDERAHGFVGGLARIRYGFVQAGATFETTDSGEAAQLNEPLQEHWRAIGGFAGVWLPYRHWADIEASLGLTSRSYVNRNRIYGPSGFDRSNAAVTFRLGVSDRVTERLFGPRVGAALVGGVDLQRYSPAWRREFLLPGGGIGATTGVTDVGGVSIGLVVVLGLELGGGVYRHR